MGDTTALNAAIAQLQTDVNALVAAFQAASDQPAIDSATAAVDTIDSGVKAALPPPPA